MSQPQKLTKAQEAALHKQEVDLEKKVSNYKLVKICLYAVVFLGTMYIMDLNDYLIDIPAGVFVFLWNGADATFFGGANLFTIDEVTAYLRFGLVGIFYLAGFMAWNGNRLNKPG